MRSPRSNNDTSRLGYTSTKEGEPSKSVEERSNKVKKSKPTCHNYGKKGKRSNKGKNSKPTCHNYGKKGHTANVCRNKTVNQNGKQKNMGHYHKYNKHGD